MEPSKASRSLPRAVALDDDAWMAGLTPYEHTRDAPGLHQCTLSAFFVNSCMLMLGVTVIINTYSYQGRADRVLVDAINNDVQFELFYATGTFVLGTGVIGYFVSCFQRYHWTWFLLLFTALGLQIALILNAALYKVPTTEELQNGWSRLLAENPEKLCSIEAQSSCAGLFDLDCFACAIEYADDCIALNITNPTGEPCGGVFGTCTAPNVTNCPVISGRLKNQEPNVFQAEVAICLFDEMTRWNGCSDHVIDNAAYFVRVNLWVTISSLIVSVGWILITMLTRCVSFRGAYASF
ncbi:hypothetical protein FVE85_5422 [Porphyridium purpureum]|uniref:Uncharacterized protein n=1 Tax=Porphyridium purpureum TaxID=35688 RepID=A0A5J4Z5D2_PORPP|nr:hypothetical protein FVE85_5422 [Porphyridium purpureum]|eukprot:POR1988..scf295_1